VGIRKGLGGLLVSEAGKSERLDDAGQAEGFAFAVAPFPLSKCTVQNGPERSRARRFLRGEADP
jgi:hypothetical protein